MARNTDGVQSRGVSLLIFERFASVTVAMKFMDDLAGFDEQACAAGTAFDVTSTYFFSRLPSERMMRVLKVWSLTWQNAVAKVQAIPPAKCFWTREHNGEVVQFMANNAILLNVQLLMLARSPSTVQESEAADTLPEPEDLRFADCVFEVVNFGQQSFVLAAQAAQHLGLNGEGMQYLRAALIRHANPVKQHHACSMIGRLLALGKRQGDCGSGSQDQ